MTIVANFNKFLILSLCPFLAFCQNCKIEIDTINYKNISYFPIDSNIIKNNKNSIILYSISKNGTSYNVLFIDSIYVLKNNFNKKVIVKDKWKINEWRDLIIQNGTYSIYSDVFSREYFDMLIINKDGKCCQIIPLGSTIFNNKNCIMNLDYALGKIVLDFEKILIEYKDVMR